MVMIHLFFQFIGWTYLEANLPNESNIQLLKSLKEGVFIITEDGASEIMFENEAASRLNARISDRTNFSFYSGKQFVGE